MESRLKKLLDDAAFNRALIVAFLAFTSVPVLVMIFRPDYGVEHWNDRRPIHEAPHVSWNLEHWKRLPFQCEWFVADRICFRNKLIRLQNLVGLRVFGSAPLGTICLKPKESPNGAIAGKEGWLFYSGNGCLRNSRCTDPFTAEELHAWQQVHQTRMRWLRDRGIGYLFFVAPDKHSIYPEYVPDCMVRQGAKSRYDQLYKELADFAPNVQTIDLRPVLLAAKKGHTCYYRSDSHWNKLGALLATSAVLKKAAERYPNFGAPPVLQDFDIRMYEGFGGDIADTHKVKNYFTDLYVDLTPRCRPGWTELQPMTHECPVWTTEHSEKSLPRVVFISDSFGLDMAGYLADRSSRFNWFLQIFTDDFPFELIERESPDLVIFEHVERKLNHVNPVSLTPPTLRVPADRWANLEPGLSLSERRFH